jgi:hypothetical protein
LERVVTQPSELISNIDLLKIWRESVGCISEASCTFYSRSHAPAWECREHRASGAGRDAENSLVPTRQRGNAVCIAPTVLDGMQKIKTS